MARLDWKTAGSLLAVGCTTLVAWRMTAAADPEAPGYVRLRDARTPAAARPASPVRPVAATFAPAANGLQPVPMNLPAPAGTPAQSATPARAQAAPQNGPVVVWEGAPVEMTGNPVIDATKTAWMMKKAEVASTMYDAGFVQGGGAPCSDPNCPNCRGRRARSSDECDCEECQKRRHRHPKTWFGHAKSNAPCSGDGCLYGCNNGCEECCREHRHGSVVYPLNPWAYDRRDARVYSAQGYGIPLAVPLAPNVHFTYNYGWGIPSSRLTPLSRLQHPQPSLAPAPAAAPANGTVTPPVPVLTPAP